eukprot:jgi/Mesvir1/19088/Mv12840-RA.1
MSQQALDAEVEAYRSLNKDLSKHQTTIQQLTSQLNENEMVLKELEILDDDANLFKLVGPVLVKQDLVEAKANVTNRVKRIEEETGRINGLIKITDEKMEKKRQEIMKLQTKMQQQQPQKRQ